MVKRRKSPWQTAHANDNAPQSGKSAGRTVHGAWPDVIPITTMELDIVETYLGDVVAGLAANDNAPEHD